MINLHPLNLSTQNLVRGQGYCLDLGKGRIAYIMFTSPMPAGDSGSGTVTLLATMWQNPGGQ
jgi:hypothetical protein